MKKTKVGVCDVEYRFNHGAAPRGRGGWAFAIGCDARTVRGDDDRIFWASFGTYAEAKRAACAEARRLGVAFIEVMP